MDLKGPVFCDFPPAAIASHNFYRVRVENTNLGFNGNLIMSAREGLVTDVSKTLAEVIIRLKNLDTQISTEKMIQNCIFFCFVEILRQALRFLFLLSFSLEILPYRRADYTAQRDETVHSYFCSHGYVCVRVDMRGSGDSEGFYYDEYEKQEQDDCCDVINWVSQQPWCTGNVGRLDNLKEGIVLFSRKTREKSFHSARKKRKTRHLKP